jgi:hypothetical protein
MEAAIAIPAALVALLIALLRQLLGPQPFAFPEQLLKAAKAIEVNADKWGGVADAAVEVKVYTIILICVLIAYYGLKTLREGK